ncbi:unnamed protein product [Chrysoparadoxa australica]
MVFFSCEGCNESLKKSQVARHVNACPARNCWGVTCVDCQVVFEGDSYAAHTSCVSEAEKYQGSLYKGKAKAAKRNPQQEWMNLIEESIDEAPSTVKAQLVRMAELGNVPRQEKKFRAFCANSLRLGGAAMNQTWGYLSSRKQQREEEKKNNKASEKLNGDTESLSASSKAEDPVPSKGKNKKRKKTSSEDPEEQPDAQHESPAINWESVTRKILKAAPDKSMLLKQLRKEAIATVMGGTCFFLCCLPQRAMTPASRLVWFVMDPYLTPSRLIIHHFHLLTNYVF